MQTIVVLLLLFASPEAAAPATTADTPQAKPAKVKKICRAGADTGSRMTSKICKTQSEWDALSSTDASRVKSDNSSGY
jgi:hypothetical protein